MSDRTVIPAIIAAMAAVIASCVSLYQGAAVAKISAREQA
jgi:hypothetical protein